jgi:hypothetical protein
MATKIYLFIVFFVGFVLCPKPTFACKSSYNASCCSKESTHKSAQKPCCNKTKQHAKGKRNSGCGGKCGDKACQCPASGSGYVVSALFEIENYIFYFPEEKRVLFHSEAHLSTGFSFLWSPPKIG